MTQITMLEEIEPERLDGVKDPASGFPILMMKAVAKDANGQVVENPDKDCDCCDACTNADGCDCCAECEAMALKAVNAAGGIDEKPDIAGAENVLQELARLIQSEAAEMATGCWDENYDIQLLTEAACLVQCFRSKEQWGDEDDGAMAKDVKTFLAKRKVNTAERKRLASEGKALPDGSYPIDNAEDLHNAAILQRSGHGDTAAAGRLIAKRAKELGVANPLANDAKKDAEVETPETEAPSASDEAVKTSEDTDPQTPDQPEADPVQEAVAKAVQSYEKRLEALEGELAKVKATPLPGGPVVSVPPSMRNERSQADNLAKAAQWASMAERINEPDLKRVYQERSAAAKAAAGVVTP